MKKIMLLGIVMLLLIWFVIAEPPKLTILNPVENDAYSFTSVQINWTINKTYDWCGYSLDNGTNVTIYRYFTGFQFDTSTTDTAPRGITWNGSSFFIIGTSKRVAEYNTSGNYTGFGFNVTAPTPEGITWNGSSFFILDLTTKAVLEYNRTGNYTGFNFSLNFSVTQPTETGARGITWNGSHFLFIGTANKIAYVFDKLGKYTGENFSVSGQDSAPLGIYDNGTHSFVIGNNNNRIYRYNSTGNFQQYNITVTRQDITPHDLVGVDNLLYVVGAATSEIYEYDTTELNSNISMIGLADGKHNLTLYCNDTKGNMSNSSLISFIVDTTNPDIVSNIDDNFTLFRDNFTFLQINYTDNVQVYEFNVSITGGLDYNLTGLDQLTYTYDTTHNLENVSVGDWEVNTTVCDRINCISDSWRFYKFNDSHIYKSNVIETTSQTFNLTIDKSVEASVKATLIYNNTVYAATESNSSTYVNYTATITVPTLTYNATNITFYWNYTVDGTEFNSTFQNQTVYRFVIDNCTLFSVTALNFTFYDEENSTIIREDITGTFDYHVGTGTSKSYSLTGDNVNNTLICIFPHFASITSDYTLYYSATNYPQRRYFVDDGILTNATTDIPLHSLYTAEGIYGRFKVVDIHQNAISGVTGTMSRTINGIYRTIEQESSDDSGLMTFWLDPDENYNFTFSKPGYITNTFSLRLTTTEIYTVTLQSAAAAQNISYSVGINYYFLPFDDVLNNNTLYNFTFNMTSSHWAVTNCTLFIKNGVTILSYNSTNYDTTFCNITITYNTSNYTTFISEAQYQLNSSITEIVSKHYTIRHTYSGNFSLKYFIDDVSAFAGAGFNDDTRMLLAFIVIFAIIGLSSYKFTTFREPEPLLAMTWILVLFFSYVGWLTLNYDAIPEIRGLGVGWLKQYIIWILVTLGVTGFFINKYYK